jgi:alkanesulfonate monooxygenase SsuD/methylene tetrahydromethanopterin reductase-like flavin-dependent oxidoreductase (luciferase family)
MTPRSGRPLKVGLVPDILGITGGFSGKPGMPPSWSELLPIVQRAEEIGFDSIWFCDHLIERGVFPGVTLIPWESWSILSAAAAVTSRIQIGTIVLCTGFRNPALVAKMADTVDEISGGRLTLGIGAGWHESEFEAFGYPFDHRYSRFEEAFTIIRTLLREGRIDFEGQYYQARNCEIRPREPHLNGPPIMVGTRGQKMLRLTARYAESWNGFLVTQGNSPSVIPPLREALDAACADVGRDPTTVGRSVAVHVNQSGFDVPGPAPITGTPAEIADQLRAFASEGIDQVQVFLTAGNLAAVEAFAPVLESLDRN